MSRTKLAWVQETYGYPCRPGGGRSPCPSKHGRCGHQSSHATHKVKTAHIHAQATYLRLEDVRRDDLRAVPVVKGERGAERRGGNTPKDSLGNNSAPTRLSCVDRLVEKVVKQERLEVGFFHVGIGDVVQEDRLPNRDQMSTYIGRDTTDRRAHLDDTASTPDTGNAGIVEIPVELNFQAR